MSFRLAPQAQSDVKAIGDRIAFEDLLAAEKLIEAFQKRWRLLASHPYSGRSRDDLLAGLRQVLVKPYISFYLIEDEHVLIVWVMHVRQDVSVEDITI